MECMDVLQNIFDRTGQAESRDQPFIRDIWNIFEEEGLDNLASDVGIFRSVHIPASPAKGNLFGLGHQNMNMGINMGMNMMGAQPTGGGVLATPPLAPHNAFDLDMINMGKHNKHSDLFTNAQATRTNLPGQTSFINPSPNKLTNAIPSASPSLPSATLNYDTGRVPDNSLLQGNIHINNFGATPSPSSLLGFSPSRVNILPNAGTKRRKLTETTAGAVPTLGQMHTAAPVATTQGHAGTQRFSISNSFTTSSLPTSSSTVLPSAVLSSMHNNSQALVGGVPRLYTETLPLQRTQPIIDTPVVAPPREPMPARAPVRVKKEPTETPPAIETGKTGKRKRGKTKVPARSRVQKGLRHFSLKVCEKVEQQKNTTYNQVADELVRELTNPETAGIGNRKAYDEKNIRRRVYDALNVLMAMGIISKEKKRITWIGLPGGVTQDLRLLNKEKTVRLDRIKRKRAHLSQLLTQQVCFKNLVTRNAATYLNATSPKLPLPFLVVHTSRDTVIRCEMTEDRRQVVFNFSAPFSINEDKDIMKHMDLSKIAPWDLPRLIPREVCSFYPQESICSQVSMGGGRHKGGYTPGLSM